MNLKMSRIMDRAWYMEVTPWKRHIFMFQPCRKRSTIIATVLVFGIGYEEAMGCCSKSLPWRTISECYVDHVRAAPSRTSGQSVNPFRALHSSSHLFSLSAVLLLEYLHFDVFILSFHREAITREYPRPLAFMLCMKNTRVVETQEPQLERCKAQAQVAHFSNIVESQDELRSRHDDPRHTMKQLHYEKSAACLFMIFIWFWRIFGALLSAEHILHTANLHISVLYIILEDGSDEVGPSSHLTDRKIEYVARRAAREISV